MAIYSPVLRTSSARAYVIVIPATLLPMMPALKMVFSGPRPRGTATVKICVATACVVVAAEGYQLKAATSENERKQEI
jgi:hypothetical protein